MKKDFLNKLFLCILPLVFTAALSGCKTLPKSPDIGFDTSVSLPIEYICPSSLSWENITDENEEVIEGFHVMRHEMKDFKVRWICVKADLNTPGVKVVATPYPDELGKSPKLRSVKKFAKENNAVVAVNASPWKNKSYPHNAVGIVKVDGVEYFPPEKGYSAICFSENPLRAVIISEQEEDIIKDYNFAFGGFSQVLKDNEIIPFNNNRRSRVSVGTNEDGSELYFFVVTTINNPTDRNGFTFEECGLVLQKLGCTDAMHFDGGHSSCIVINKKESQKPLLNRKIPIAIGLKK